MHASTSVCAALYAFILASGAHAHALSIPDVQAAAKRTVTIDDLTAVRTIDSLSVSPDGRRYAILVRQADPSINDYRTAWFSGSMQGGGLTRLGDGGEVRPRVVYTGHMPGEIGASESRWSPDGQWLAYTVRSNDQVQLWRSRVDGSVQEQLTNNVADVREFAWSEDGAALYFTVGTPRAELRVQEQARAWQGYRYDEDFWTFTDLLGPQLIRAPETDLSLWVVTLEDRQERLGGEAEKAAFARTRADSPSAVDVAGMSAPDKVVPPVVGGRGNLAWRVRSNPVSPTSRLVASLPGKSANAIRCAANECVGAIKKIWWSERGQKVLFWRGEGLNDAQNGFYSWSPASGKVSTIVRLRDDDLRLCSQAAGDRVICARESAAQPAHVVAVDLQSARTQIVADLNPEFRNLRLGKVERFEWDTPKFPWNEPGGELAGLYPPRTYGYILYPPDFDPGRKYPVFIDPYVARGFNPLGAEHALHAYAANGIVVLRTAFPQRVDESVPGLGLRQLYSAELGYPHLTMLMESTLRALDLVSARGFIDERRVGIGGVSHGTFVPLYMLQKYDRIAAISISSPHWGPLQHYWTTRKARDLESAREARSGNPVRQPQSRGADFWNGVDIADHVETAEAPILMQLAAQETYALVRLIRNLADAGKPYDVYVFPAETHIKWQAAHLHAITSRNLDWFRFWLQDFEDPSPAKAEQYLRWRKLREQQEASARKQ
jgi:dipeptidyl aminopeptidase/acylaminoacyl peptidase